MNSNGGTTGDAWNTTSVVITVEDPCVDADGDGFTDCDGDCDDGDVGVYPAAVNY